MITTLKKLMPLLKVLQEPAQDLLNNKKSLKLVLSEASSKFKHLAQQSKNKLKELKVILELLMAWVKGEYKKAPWKSLLAATAGVLYFLNPFDLVPDFLGAVGFADDAMVLGWVIKNIQSDLDDFKSWKKERQNTYQLRSADYERLD